MIVLDVDGDAHRDDLRVIVRLAGSRRVDAWAQDRLVDIVDSITAAGGRVAILVDESPADRWRYLRLALRFSAVRLGTDETALRAWLEDGEGE